MTQLRQQILIILQKSYNIHTTADEIEQLVKSNSLVDKPKNPRTAEDIISHLERPDTDSDSFGVTQDKQVRTKIPWLLLIIIVIAVVTLFIKLFTRC